MLPVLNPQSIPMPEVGGLTVAGAFIDAFRTSSIIAREKEQSRRAEGQLAMQQQRQEWEREERERQMPLEQKRAELDYDLANLRKQQVEMGLDAQRKQVRQEAQLNDMLMKSISAPVTQYSLGKDVGGPDETQDKWTNKGYSATGKNLTEGMAAVNPKVHPIGTILRDNATGETFIAGDKHGNKDPNVIDLYKDPQHYEGGKEVRNFSIVGKVDEVPNTPEGVKSLLDQYKASTKAPPYIHAVTSSEPDEVAIVRQMPLKQAGLLAQHRQLTSLAKAFPAGDPRSVLAESKIMEIEALPEFAAAQAEHASQMQAAVIQRGINTSILAAPRAQVTAFTREYNFGISIQDGQAVPISPLTKQPLSPGEQEAFQLAWSNFDARVKKYGLPTEKPAISPEVAKRGQKDLIAGKQAESPQAQVQPMLPQTYGQVQAMKAAEKEREAVKEIHLNIDQWARENGVTAEQIANSVNAGEKIKTGGKVLQPQRRGKPVQIDEELDAEDFFARNTKLSKENVRRWASAYKQTVPSRSEAPQTRPTGKIKSITKVE